ncbi:MAG: hypothetical protein Q4C47_08245, partial [Planctomycetia bacterium]|nr:hypothetical protein [Planctomycetia bacterium]
LSVVVWREIVRGPITCPLPPVRKGKLIVRVRRNYPTFVTARPGRWVGSDRHCGTSRRWTGIRAGMENINNPDKEPEETTGNPRGNGEYGNEDRRIVTGRQKEDRRADSPATILVRRAASVEHETRYRNRFRPRLTSGLPGDIAPWKRCDPGPE